MRNSNKLNLNDLKVESFITSMEGKDSQTIKGGSSVLCFDVAVTAVFVVVVATQYVQYLEKSRLCKNDENNDPTLVQNVPQNGVQKK